MEQLGIKAQLMESRRCTRELMRQPARTAQRESQQATERQHQERDRCSTDASAILILDSGAAWELWVFHYNQS